MQIPFEKIHGAGNDFVVFDNRQGTIELNAEQVQQICDRHFGVGADGIIEVRKSLSPKCVAYMYYRNADGSIAEMCGNGVRCFARYLVDKGIASEEEIAARSFIIDTKAGHRPLTFDVDENGNLCKARVGMGEPSFRPELIPTTLSSTRQIDVYNSKLEQEQSEDAVIQSVITRGGEKFVVSCVNMGNPHAVMFLEYMDSLTARAFAHHPQNIDLDSPGSYLESNTELFPQKTNVEIATINGKNQVQMRVYERGVGETLACGTGACAVAIVAILLGLVKRDEPVLVNLPGGTLEVEWLPNNQVMLTGPVETAFSGTITY